MHEWPLILFTLLMQLSIGCVVMTWCYQQFAFEELRRNELTRVIRPAMLIAFIFGLAGLAASLAHLGNPFHAFYTLTHISDSWMSREILFTAIFMALLFLAVVFTFIKGAVPFGLLVLVVVVGLIDIYMMSAIYDHTVFTLWNGWQTYAAFYASMLLMGGILSALFVLPKLNELGSITNGTAKTLFNVTLIGLGLATVATIAMFFIAAPGLPLSPSLINKTLPEGLLCLTSIRYVFMISGMVLIGKVLVNPLSEHVRLSLFSALLAMIMAEGIGRYVFFSVGG